MVNCVTSSMHVLWVNLGVRTCDVFSLVCYLIRGFGFCLTVSWLLVFSDKPVFTPSKNIRVFNVCISISEWSVISHSLDPVLSLFEGFPGAGCSKPHWLGTMETYTFLWQLMRQSLKNICACTRLTLSGAFSINK